MSKLLDYTFILLLVLIVVAYYFGVKTDAQAALSGTNQILQTVSGRNGNNQFAAYPKQG